MDCLRLEKLRLKKKDDLHKEEHKKNQTKSLPIPNWPIPQRPPVITSQSATWQMDKGNCIPLWYYTNKGLENTLATYNSTDNDTLTLLCWPDGSTSLIPASSTKESKGVVKDHDIEWEDFCIAALWMIEAMGRANWPNECIQLMVHFWANLWEHPFCPSSAPFEQKSPSLSSQTKKIVTHSHHQHSLEL